MHRQPLKKLLVDYQPTSTAEDRCKQQMLTFLEAHVDCFERRCIPGHFTASAWLLNNTADKALLLYHTKLQRWLQPGGHSDGNPDLLQVALCEAREESGIQDIVAVSTQIFDLDIHEIPAYKDDPVHLHYDVRFLLQVTSDAALQANAESEALAWFSQDRTTLPTQERSVVRMFDKWVASY